MKLTIITINYNDADALSQTIDSVRKQTWQEFEYIIIDGGSTDKSLEVIKTHQQRLSYWVTEPDNGVFHAMNKGIIKAKGDYLLMLNAGDYLCDSQVLEKVFSLNRYEESILIGDVYRAANGKIFERSYYHKRLTFNFFRNTSLSHQGTFIKKELHNIVGMYDETLKYSSDWKFFTLAICKHNVSYRSLFDFVSVCDCSGLTNNSQNFAFMQHEMGTVLKQEFSAFVEDYEQYDFLNRKTFKSRVENILPVTKKYLKKVKYIRVMAGLLKRGG